MVSEKGFSAHPCLLSMLEKRKMGVDNKKNPLVHFLLISPKLLTAFSHELLLAKLNASGFSLPALRLMQSCLSTGNKEQK